MENNFRLELPCVYTTEETDEQEQMEESLGIKFEDKPKPEIRPVIFYTIDAVAINKNKDLIKELGTEDVCTIWAGNNYFICALSQDEIDRMIMEVKNRSLNIPNKYP